ncbi:complement regulator-acquiring protein [Borreliella lusitaniae]|uniref:Complement regulator-acquiring protein n=1 Tax=Borreliella lusitaniae TaxID=100177 RepID=A0ABZ0CPS5_9SPIR|nr:complement regulator-acquiring protein [Borreliella lusitaniae]WNY69179.1 complement regulator-acquiring protein [Borreliella lusitaniae]
MRKLKINMIKLNIIKVALALICISCAPDGTPSSELNSKISKEIKDFNPAKNQEYYKKPKALKLETAPEYLKYLEDQKNEEDEKIAKIDSSSDFLKTFEVSSDIDHRLKLDQDNRMRLKRIIYSSLDYETQKIDTLKEILEKLKEQTFNQKNEKIKDFFAQIVIGMQKAIDNNTASLEKNKNSNQKEKEEEKKDALMGAKELLNKKEEFAKRLNTIIQAYKQNHENIQKDMQKLANYIHEHYEYFDSFKQFSYQ